MELFVLAAVLLLDDDELSEIFPNFGFDSSALASFCCFQLGVFQLGVFSSTVSTFFGAVAAACFLHEGTGLSGVDGAELSGVVLVAVFHDGVD